jgi:hypothetical protein
MALDPSNVYRLDRSGHYQFFLPIPTFDVLSPINGQPLSGRWKPVRVEVGAEEDGTVGPPSDFPYLSSDVPVVSERAAKKLATILESNGELLPLIAPNGVYFAYNVTRLIDAIDRDQITKQAAAVVLVVTGSEMLEMPPEAVGVTIETGMDMGVAGASPPSTL